MFKQGQEIKLRGEEWKILTVGATNGRETVLHCAHKTKGVHQRNGFEPGKIMVWVDHKTLETRRCH